MKYHEVNTYMVNSILHDRYRNWALRYNILGPFVNDFHSVQLKP